MEEEEEKEEEEEEEEEEGSEVRRGSGLTTAVQVEWPLLYLLGSRGSRTMLQGSALTGLPPSLPPPRVVTLAAEGQSLEALCTVTDVPLLETSPGSDKAPLLLPLLPLADDVLAEGSEEEVLWSGCA